MTQGRFQDFVVLGQLEALPETLGLDASLQVVIAFFTRLFTLRTCDDESISFAVDM